MALRRPSLRGLAFKLEWLIVEVVVLSLLLGEFLSLQWEQRRRRKVGSRAGNIVHSAVGRWTGEKVANRPGLHPPVAIRIDPDLRLRREAGPR
jgi:hypothetical protein